MKTNKTIKANLLYANTDASPYQESYVSGRG